MHLFRRFILRQSYYWEMNVMDGNRARSVVVGFPDTVLTVPRTILLMQQNDIPEGAAILSRVRLGWMTEKSVNTKL